MSTRRGGGGAKSKAAANAAFQAMTVPAAAAPPSHPVENMRDHRAFLVRSLARNDEDLSVLVDLNRTLHKVRQNIVEACGEELLLDLGEGLLELTPCGRDLMVALPSSSKASSSQDLLDWKNHRKPELEAKIPIYDDHKQLCVDFLLRMKLRRRLMNRFVRRLNRLAHAMDGHDTSPPLPPSYGDLRLHMDPRELEHFKLHDQLQKQARERIEAYRKEHPDSIVPLISVDEEEEKAEEETTKQQEEEPEAKDKDKEEDAIAAEGTADDKTGTGEKEKEEESKTTDRDDEKESNEAKDNPPMDDDKMDVDEPETKDDVKSEEQQVEEVVDKMDGDSKKTEEETPKAEEPVVAAKQTEETAKKEDEEMKDAEEKPVEPIAADPTKEPAEKVEPSDQSAPKEEETKNADDNASSSDDMFANSDDDAAKNNSDKKSAEESKDTVTDNKTAEKAAEKPVEEASKTDKTTEAESKDTDAVKDAKAEEPTEEAPKTPVKAEPVTMEAKKEAAADALLAMFSSPTSAPTTPADEPENDEATSTSKRDEAKSETVPTAEPSDDKVVEPKPTDVAAPDSTKATEEPAAPDSTTKATEEPDFTRATEEAPKEEKEEAPKPTEETPQVEQTDPSKEEPKTQPTEEVDSSKVQETTNETSTSTNEDKMEVDAPAKEDEEKKGATTESTAETKTEEDAPEPADSKKSNPMEVEEKAVDSMEVDDDAANKTDDKKPEEAPQTEESGTKVAEEAISAEGAAKSGNDAGKDETANTEPTETAAAKPDEPQSTPVKKESDTPASEKNSKEVVSTPKKEPLIELPPLREMNQFEKDFEILKDFVDAYEKEIDPMTGEVSYTITKSEDRQEDYELLQYGAGIGATGRSLSVKEKEVEFQRWQTALLGKIPEAPTFEELGMKNCVFKLEERRKRLLQQKEEKDMQSNKKRKLSDASSPSKKSKAEGDEERKPRNVGAVERKSPKKDAEAEKEEEVAKKKVKPLSLVPLPSFHDSDLRRIRMIHGDLIDTSMLASAKKRLDDVTDKYNKAFATSNMLNERKQQIENHLSHMTLIYRKRAQQAQSEHERNRAVLKQRWLEQKAKFDATRMKKYLPSSSHYTPAGTSITQRVCSHYPVESTGYIVGHCLADIIDGVINKHQSNTGDDSHRPFEEPAPFDPKNVVFDPNSSPQLTLLQHQQRIQVPMQKELQAIHVKLSASEEERKNIWKKMAKAKQEFEACEYQRSSRTGRGGRAAPVSSVQSMSYMPNRGNTMRAAQGYAPSGNVNVSDYKYSAARVRERIANDGSVAPVTAPKQDSDGYYQRPTGRGRKGMEWDPINGVWRPASY